MVLTLVCGCECVVLVSGRGDSPLPWGRMVKPCAIHQAGPPLVNGEDQARHDAETG